MILPIIGEPKDWFPYWAMSCGGRPLLPELWPKGSSSHRVNNVVDPVEVEIDWLVFHEGMESVDRWRRDWPSLFPPNMRFIQLPKGGIVHLYAEKAAAATNNPRLAGIYRERAKQFGGGLLVQLKGLLGTVFEDYLHGYTHWAFLDYDVLWGDVYGWLEADELLDYDVVTFSFGDHSALYLRGQLTVMKNTPRVNRLWTQCEQLVGDEFPAGTPLDNIDEGCFSSRLLREDDVRVLVATKQRLPDSSVWYWLDGTLVERPEGSDEATREFERALVAYYTSAMDAAAAAATTTTTSTATATGGTAMAATPASPPLDSAPFLEPEAWKPVTATARSYCAGWVPMIYRRCLWRQDLGDACRIKHENGTAYRQGCRRARPDQTAFIHFFMLKHWHWNSKHADEVVRLPPPHTRPLVVKVSRQDGIVTLLAAPDDMR